MNSELRKYGSTSVVQTSNIGFTSEVSDYLVVHTGPGVNERKKENILIKLGQIQRRTSFMIARLFFFFFFFFAQTVSGES